MTPERAPATDLVVARVAREQEWAHALWLARHSFLGMRRVASLPEHEGGLGYDLSEQALKGLVDGARAARGDLSTSRAGRIERQAAEVDERARAARHDFAAAHSRAAALDRAIADFEVYDVATARALADLVAQRAQLASDVEKADRRLDVVQQREAKLFGLDQPTEAKLDVVTHDGVLDDLNAALARLGEQPVTPER